ncbi:MAG: hypothetical protein IPG10_18880 [Flavobacteriales bacterium]|nr:hypothetical protein [Flavobacteriales bacterium]MBK6755950.1 hypothetical protein [Flavobacteriales bacterium]MBK7087242.1 hypothetical protein [Flavobacteriales bacterium]MBK7752056.1 hypothetical protein [Flavobacteriales bacterium]MBK9073963.1 hypothetical protein [Flavobacteriales bacterium]
MRITSLLLALFIGICCSAQPPSALQTRRATSSGSYPVYLCLGGSAVNGGIREFSRIASTDPLPALFKRAGGTISPFGFNVKLGFILSRGRPFRYIAFPNFIFEADFNNYVTDLKARDLGTLIMHYSSASVRAGVRYNLFYPFVFQFSLGPIVHQNTGMFLNLPDDQEGGATIEVPQTSLFKGMEYRLRLSLVDPAGTGGGLGIYFEAQWSDLFLESLTELEPLYSAVGRPTYYTRPNLDYRAFNFGLIVPLALPFR